MPSAVEIASKAVQDLDRFVRLLSAFEASQSVAESKAAYGEAPDEEVASARDWSDDPAKAWSELGTLGIKLGPQLEHRSSRAVKAMILGAADWRHYQTSALWSPEESTESLSDPDRLQDIHTVAWDLRWLLAIAQREASFFLRETRVTASYWPAGGEVELAHPIREACRLIDAVMQAGFSVAVSEPPHDERSFGLALYQYDRSIERFGHLMPTPDMAPGSDAIASTRRWFHDALNKLESTLDAAVTGEPETLVTSAEDTPNISAVCNAAPNTNQEPVASPSWRARLERLRESFLELRDPRLALAITVEPPSDSLHFPKQASDWLSQRGYRQHLECCPIGQPLDVGGWPGAIEVAADGEPVGEASVEGTPAWRAWHRFREDAEKASAAFNDAPALLRARYGGKAKADADGWLGLVLV